MPEKGIKSLELELKTVVSHHMVLEIESGSSGRPASTPNHWNHLFSPLCSDFWLTYNVRDNSDWFLVISASLYWGSTLQTKTAPCRIECQKVHLLWLRRRKGGGKTGFPDVCSYRNYLSGLLPVIFFLLLSLSNKNPTAREGLLHLEDFSVY